VPTLNDQGGNDSIDSDADPFTGLTAVTSPARAEADLTLGLGLVSPGSITGVKFNDRNANNTRDVGEEGLVGWTIFVDADGDGQLGAGEPSTVTGAGGGFTLTGLPPGEHLVRELTQDYWTLTARPSTLTVPLRGGQNVSGVPVGGHTGVRDSTHAPAWPETSASAVTYPGMGAVEVASDGAGNFVAVWPTYDTAGGPETVRGRRFSAAGAPLGDEFAVNAVPVPGRSNPRVAMDQGGDFVVVWQQQVGQNDLEVFARRYDAAGNPRGAEFPVNTTAAGLQLEPDVAMSSGGGFVVTWRGFVGPSEDRVYFQRFDANGERAGGEDSFVSVGIQHPAVSVAPGGEFVIAWTGWRPERLYDAEIFARRFDADGRAVGAPILVNSVTQGDQTEADVAVGPDGGFVVAWQGRAPGETIRARRFNGAGVAQGDELPLGYGNAPRVARGGDGSFVVTWQTSYGSNEDVLAVRFNAAGLQQRVVFSPGITAGYQSRPSPAMDDQGNFVIAWSTSGPGVPQHMAAQRFVLDHAPTTSGLPDLAVAAGTPQSVVDLHAAFADDRDADGQLTYSVTGNTNPALFTSIAIDPGAGTLTLAYAPAVAGESAVTVRATDRNGQYVETVFRARVGPAEAAAQVTDVFVNGTAWPAAFRQALQGAGLGEVAYGFRVPAGDSLNELPWAGIDRISMRFNRDVTLAQAALAIEGVNGDYDVTGFAYNAATRTATWTLRAPLINDSVALGVAGASAATMLAAGGGAVRLSVLPGDVNRDGRVNALDMAQVRAKMQTSTANPGAGSRRYSPFHDVNGDGRINERDVLLVRAGQSRTVPVAPPAPVTPAAAGAPARRPATRPGVRQELFSSTPILTKV
jgi:hypothetical protein